MSQAYSLLHPDNTDVVTSTIGATAIGSLILLGSTGRPEAVGDRPNASFLAAISTDPGS